MAVDLVPQIIQDYLFFYYFFVLILAHLEFIPILYDNIVILSSQKSGDVVILINSLSYP